MKITFRAPAAYTALMIAATSPSVAQPPLADYVQQRLDQLVTEEMRKLKPDELKVWCSNAGLMQGNSEYKEGLRTVGPREARLCTDEAKVPLQAGNRHDPRYGL